MADDKLPPQPKNKIARPDDYHERGWRPTSGTPPQGRPKPPTNPASGGSRKK